MTKAEIIRKLAKRAGISDLDAKVFFEAFLRQAVERLNPGDSVRIKGFGYFQRRTGKIKNSHDSISNKVFADLIVFYPFQTDPEEGAENIIFNVPARSEEEYNVIDSYFSISFGKPVIPLKDANLNEFYIPPVGYEFKRQIEIKAEKLLNESELVENFIKENELLLIESGLINPNQMEIDWDDTSIARGSEGEIFSVAEFDSNKASGNVTWDFGEDIEKQIQEESILDTGADDKLFVDYKDLEGLSWEFGIDIDEKEEERKSSEPETEKTNEKIKNEFERVKSFTSEYKIDQNKKGLTKSEMDLSWSFNTDDSETDSELLKSITQEINEEGFAEVKIQRPKYKYETDISESTSEESIILGEKDLFPENESKPETEIVHNKEKTPDWKKDVIELADPEESVFLTPSEYVPAVEPEKGTDKQVDTFPPVTDRTPSYTRKKGIGIFVISSLILILCGAVFLYIKIIKFVGPVKTPVRTEIGTQHISSVTIERDFDLPLTYPYIRDSSVKAAVEPFAENLSSAPPADEIKYENLPDENKTADGNKPVESNKPIEVPKPVEKEIPKVETKNIRTDLKPLKLKEFIYKSGDKFLVQVSSWPSEQAAQKHASFFRNKGLQTDIEKANLSKGYWYRVLVGYFNSEREASSFYNKNK